VAVTKDMIYLFRKYTQQDEILIGLNMSDIINKYKFPVKRQFQHVEKFLGLPQILILI
jgi:hypothetical protein